jgi:hypothetical protein
MMESYSQKNILENIFELDKRTEFLIHEKICFSLF